jgi:hypothetical protein
VDTTNSGTGLASGTERPAEISRSGKAEAERKNL